MIIIQIAPWYAVALGVAGLFVLLAVANVVYWAGVRRGRKEGPAD